MGLPFKFQKHSFISPCSRAVIVKTILYRSTIKSVNVGVAALLLIIQTQLHCNQWILGSGCKCVLSSSVGSCAAYICSSIQFIPKWDGQTLLFQTFLFKRCVLDLLLSNMAYCLEYVLKV